MCRLLRAGNSILRNSATEDLAGLRDQFWLGNEVIACGDKLHDGREVTPIAIERIGQHAKEHSKAGTHCERRDKYPRDRRVIGLEDEKNQAKEQAEIGARKRAHKGDASIGQLPGDSLNAANIIAENRKARDWKVRACQRIDGELRVVIAVIGGDDIALGDLGHGHCAAGRGRSWRGHALILPS